MRGGGQAALGVVQCCARMSKNTPATWSRGALRRIRPSPAPAVHVIGCKRNLSQRCRCCKPRQNAQCFRRHGGIAAQVAVSSASPQDPEEESLYASPEELLSAGAAATPKSDVYSAGLLFFELFNPIPDPVQRRRALRGLRHRILPLELLQVGGPIWFRISLGFLRVLSFSPERSFFCMQALRNTSCPFSYSCCGEGRPYT